MSDVDPEEAEALLEGAEGEAEGPDSPQGKPAVEPRDFGRPRRRSASSLEGMRRALAELGEELDRNLSRLFVESVRTEVETITEVNADGLFHDIQPPFALGCFTVHGQPAWIRWELRAAIGAIERLLGSGAETPESRTLSGIERGLLLEIFSHVVDVVARSLQVDAADLSIVSAPEEITDWRAGGDDAEPYRLGVTMPLEGLGETSRFRIWLPVQKEAERASDVRSAPLPDHLNRVQVELGAHLGAADVALRDLLAMELGDVIPLGTTLSDPLILRVEGRPCGTAEMGSLRGNRAIRVLDAHPDLESLS